jgi:hypothetical protein
MNLLRKRIKCQKFLSLIKNSITTGYTYKGDFFTSSVGIFQGNVTSPILNNIYLHELDLFMANLTDSFNKGKTRRKNPVYRRFSYQISKVKNDTIAIKRIRKQM